MKHKHIPSWIYSIAACLTVGWMLSPSTNGAAGYAQLLCIVLGLMALVQYRRNKRHKILSHAETVWITLAIIWCLPIWFISPAIRQYVFEVPDKTPTVVNVETVEGTSVAAERCMRIEPYAMRPEFSRALSLIVQRLHERLGGDMMVSARSFVEPYYQALDTKLNIQNCVAITYAEDDASISDSEGVFWFNSDSTTQRLDISVSPRYSAKDDLVTAILLSHELSHAIDRVLYGPDIMNSADSCIQTEMKAFKQEIYFFWALNQAEQDSLYLRSSDSQYPEIRSLIEMVYGYRTTDGLDKMLDKYVRQSDYYRSQCGVK